MHLKNRNYPAPGPVNCHNTCTTIILTCFSACCFTTTHSKKRCFCLISLSCPHHHVMPLIFLNIFISLNILIFNITYPMILFWGSCELLPPYAFAVFSSYSCFCSKAPLPCWCAKLTSSFEVFSIILPRLQRLSPCFFYLCGTEWRLWKIGCLPYYALWRVIFVILRIYMLRC